MNLVNMEELEKQLLKHYQQYKEVYSKEKSIKDKIKQLKDQEKKHNRETDFILIFTAFIVLLTLLLL